MKVLVVAEHDSKSIKAGVLHAVTAAAKIGGEIDVLVAGHQCAEAAASAGAVAGISKVLMADAPCLAHPLAENLADLVASIASNYTHIVAAASASGKNVMPRVAALLDVAQISEIVAVETANIFVRPIYAGNALAAVESLDPIKVITVRATGFDAAALGGTAPIETLAALPDSQLSRLLGQELTQSDRPELTSARIVISGGRGLQSGDNFALLEALAGKLDAAIGASRAAVDAGYVPNDYHIGQTGKIVAPELYVAVGISGAIQHLAGMKDSHVIVAINKDADAPIFQIADYGLVADLFQAVPELTAELG